MSLPESTLALLRALGEAHAVELSHHNALRPPPGTLAVGGAHMDPFFRMEALDGVMEALRAGVDVNGAIAAGKQRSTVTVRLWNSCREYQVHRSAETVWRFTERTVAHCQRICSKVDP